MSNEIILYESPAFKVTTEYAKNWRKTFRLKNIEKVEVSRNYVIFVIVGMACIFALVAGWNAINGLQTIILFIGAIFGCGSYSAGTLYMQSRVVSEPAFVWVDIKELRQVRDAIDKAIEIRNRREDRA